MVDSTKFVSHCNQKTLHHNIIVIGTPRVYTKIKTRHPHVFSDLELKNAEEVEQNWGKMKNDSNANLANNNKDIPNFFLIHIYF